MGISSGSSLRFAARLALAVLPWMSGCVLGNRTAMRSSVKPSPVASSPALLALTDTPAPAGKARVRANAGADGVPVDAPGRAGAARLNDGSGDRPTVERGLAPAEVGPGTPRSRGFQAAFQRLEAALDGSDTNPAPPPPPLPRSLAPPTIRLVAAGPAVVATATAPQFPDANNTTPPAVTASGLPRPLNPAPALAAVIRIPDVTDWSELNDEHPTGRNDADASPGPFRRWWMVGIGLVVLGGLVRFSGRFLRRGGPRAA